MSESVLQIYLIVNNHLFYMDLIAFRYSHISVFVCVGVGECLYVSVLFLVVFAFVLPLVFAFVLSFLQKF